MKRDTNILEVNKCESCGIVHQGNFHTFYFGKWTGSTRDALSKTSFFMISGSITSFICTNCRWKSVFKSPQLWATLIILSLTEYSIFQTGINNGNLVKLLIQTSLPMVLLIFLILAFTGWLFGVEYLDFWYNAGIHQAHRIHRKSLFAQGYNVFKTPEEYKKLVQGSQLNQKGK